MSEDKVGAWVIGRNIPGYLPESDTYAFTDWAEAESAYREMVREWAIESDEEYSTLTSLSPGGDYLGSDLATVESILADDPPQTDQDYSMTVFSNTDDHIALWLMWSPDREVDSD